MDPGPAARARPDAVADRHPGARGLRSRPTPRRPLHWRRNHDITVRTLAEDFAIGESIQGGLSSGANEELRFGRFEGALDRFNRTVEREVGAGG